MKTRWLLMSGGLFLLLSVAVQVGLAVGTPAGTAITNQAQVSYMAGTNARTALSNTTTLYVAHRVAGSFDPGSASGSGVDNRTLYFGTTFLNQGNRADDFAISFNANVGYTVDMLQDLNGNGTFDAGEGVITSTGSLAADASIKMLVRVQIAAGRPDNESVNITATLASTAGNSGNIIVANPNASFTFTVSYLVNRPVIAFTGSQSTVADNAQRIPGANVTYSLSLRNTGLGDVAGSSTVTFAVSPHFRFVSATSGGVLSNPLANGNGGLVTWTFPAAQLVHNGPDNNFEVVLQVEQVTNDATGAPAGTTVYAMTTSQSTQTKVDFNDGVNNYSQDNANSFNFAVGTASGVVIAQVTPDGSAEPGNTVEYHYTLKNSGNAADGYSLAQAHNASGNLDVAHVFSLTAGGAAVTAVAGVAQGATVDFYVRVTVPDDAMSAQTIVRDISATTQTATPTAPTGGSTSSSDVLTTTVRAAVVAISVTPAEIVSGDLNGKVVPGTVLRYTVTVANSGSAPAANISASNVVEHTGSNAIVLTSVNIDANGDDGYEFQGVGLPYDNSGVHAAVSGGFLTVQFPTVAPSGHVSYQYDVTVQ